MLKSLLTSIPRSITGGQAPGPDPDPDEPTRTSVCTVGRNPSLSLSTARAYFVCAGACDALGRRTVACGGGRTEAFSTVVAVTPIALSERSSLCSSRSSGYMMPRLLPFSSVLFLLWSRPPAPTLLPPPRERER